MGKMQEYLATTMTQKHSQTTQSVGVRDGYRLGDDKAASEDRVNLVSLSRLMETCTNNQKRHNDIALFKILLIRLILLRLCNSKFCIGYF